MSTDWSANISRFTGFAELYDRYRAGPPAQLAPLLQRYLGDRRPKLVVDLGSGTGLSSRYWTDQADRVIGIEPSADMRRHAEAVGGPENLSYREGFAHATGLPDACADIVFCMQALHWMEPPATFREAVRILRPGGIFAACDYEWPPSVGSALIEAAYDDCAGHAQHLEQARGLRAGLQHWNKTGHLARLKESGCFRFVRELMLTHADEGIAARFVGVMLSQGPVQQALARGVSQTELGLTEFAEKVAAHYGSVSRPWHWSARLWLGVSA